MITKEVISKVLENIKNDQMLNVLAEHIRVTLSDDKVSRFIEMCLCDNNEIKSFIKTKDDFNKMKILEVVDKSEPSRCITSITDICDIDCIKCTIIVYYDYYRVTYHAKQDMTDIGVYRMDDIHKYSNIHTDSIYHGIATINYKINDVLV